MFSGPVIGHGCGQALLTPCRLHPSCSGTTSRSSWVTLWRSLLSFTGECARLLSLATLSGGLGKPSSGYCLEINYRHVHTSFPNSALIQGLLLHVCLYERGCLMGIASPLRHLPADMRAFSPLVIQKGRQS